MSDAAIPLPTTLAECHARLRETAVMIGALEATNARQQATIETQRATIDEQQDVLRKMQRDLALLKRTVFGQRRERFTDPSQGMLFEVADVGNSSSESNASEDDALDELADDSTGDLADPKNDKKPSRRGGRSRRVFPECLPREERVHKLTDEELLSELEGTNFRRFLKKVGEWIDYTPPQMTVIVEYEEVIAIDNPDATQTTMVTATRPPRILNCFAGPSLLAGLAVNHFSDHLPYYRLEDILQRSGLVIDRSTQCRWMLRLATELTPLTDWMRILALQSPVVQADETPVKMLAPGQGKTMTTYLWAILGDKQHPYTTFSFTESRARAGPAEFFADFSGTLVSDAYTGYEYLAPLTQGRIQLAGCHAHARRKFEELHNLGPTEATSRAMGYFQRLFDIEDELRELSDESRHEQRQLRSRPLLAEFKCWMDKQLETLRPKHDLRGAINYMTTRWECFERFLESGAIAMDNNASERAVKNAVIGKKNWLFFGSPAGGHAAAVFYTLTATCRRLRMDSFAYLKDVLERLPLRDVNDPASLTELLPDQWLVKHPEARLKKRADESNDKATQKRERRAQRREKIA